MKFFSVKIAGIDQSFKDVITLVFDINSESHPDFQYYPGQHIVMRIMSDGKEIRRPYALTSSPFADERPSITIERKKGGVCSAYIFERAQLGMSIDISSGHGFFYADINSPSSKNYYLFAQGIGICPVISIIKSVLKAESVSRVFLLYESKNQNSILFEKELAHLIQQYANRFSLTHLLSSPSILPSLKSRPGPKGKINDSSVRSFIHEYSPQPADEFYMSGSEQMNHGVQQTLTDANINSEYIHAVQFYTKPSTELKIGEFQSIEVNLEGNTSPVQGSANQTILEILKTANQPTPYACEAGICGTCAAKLLDGEVEMKSQRALEDVDVEKGWILTCQALAKSKKIRLKF